MPFLSFHISFGSGGSSLTVTNARAMRRKTNINMYGGGDGTYVCKKWQLKGSDNYWGKGES